MITPSEVQEDIGYSNPTVYRLPNTSQKFTPSPKPSEKPTLDELRNSQGKLVRIRMTKGMHNGQVFKMAERFANDLIKRGKAEKI